MLVECERREKRHELSTMPTTASLLVACDRRLLLGASARDKGREGGRASRPGKLLSV